MALACTIWGLSPLYYKLIAHIPPLEVLAHRTIWSLVAFSGVLAIQGRLGTFQDVLRSRSVLTLGAAGLMIASNWFLFILSIQIGRATEASLGYYIFPLVAVALGFFFFNERPGRLQWLAIGLAAVAVLFLTVGFGAAPWIALALATTFGGYGMIKKRLTIGPVISVTGEVALLAPIALLVLILGTQELPNTRDLALLILSGPLTATPLILFSYASRRIAYGTLGLVQYVNPTLQFVCAVVVFGEPFGPINATAFALIWTALALYSGAGFWKSARSASRS